MGARDMRRDAARKGRSLVRREGRRTLGADIADTAGAIFDIGRSALAELAHMQARASEYVLGEHGFTVKRAGSEATYRYSDVKAIETKGDRMKLILENGSVTVKPHAYIVSGRVRVPVGWSRNGIEVAYDILLDELSARCERAGPPSLAPQRYTSSK